ncbi:hypothetical protein ACOME3_004391 [Neoechinorhynchus agilis]
MVEDLSLRVSFLMDLTVSDFGEIEKDLNIKLIKYLFRKGGSNAATIHVEEILCGSEKGFFLIMSPSQDTGNLFTIALFSFCQSCARWGYFTHQCSFPPRCSGSSEAHSTSKCPQPQVVKCPNCGQNHPAFSRKCAAAVRFLNECFSIAKESVPNSKSVDTIPKQNVWTNSRPPLIKASVKALGTSLFKAGHHGPTSLDFLIPSSDSSPPNWASHSPSFFRESLSPQKLDHISHDDLVPSLIKEINQLRELVSSLIQIKISISKRRIQCSDHSC